MSEASPSEGFPKVSRDDWMKRVEAVLKGAPFAESLMSDSSDGIAIEPLYDERDGPRAWRGTAAPWIVTQRLALSEET